MDLYETQNSEESYLYGDTLHRFSLKFKQRIWKNKLSKIGCIVVANESIKNTTSNKTCRDIHVRM